MISRTEHVVEWGFTTAALERRTSIDTWRTKGDFGVRSHGACLYRFPKLVVGMPADRTNNQSTATTETQCEIYKMMRYYIQLLKHTDFLH
jgi:hypothetical protein